MWVICLALFELALELQQLVIIYGGLFFEDLVATHCVLRACNEVLEVQWCKVCSLPSLFWLAVRQQLKMKKWYLGYNKFPYPTYLEWRWRKTKKSPWTCFHILASAGSVVLLAPGYAGWVIHGSGKGLHQSKSREKIAVLGRETFFPAYAKTVQPCATQRLVTKPFLPVQLAVLTASSAESLGLCLIGLA